MARADEKKVNPYAAAVGLIALVGGLMWWQWPGIVAYQAEGEAHAINEERRAKERAAYEAKAKAAQDAVRTKAKLVGLKGVIDGIVAKPRLTQAEQDQLSEAVLQYTSSLKPDPMSFNANGAPIFSGPQAKYLTRVYARTRETYAAPNPSDAEVAAMAKTPPVDAADATDGPSEAPTASGWRTVAHFTGHGMKNTPRFSISSDEWRIRWKAKGDGIFQIYAIGTDGMPQPAANVQGSDSDETYMHGAGSYYLDFNTSGEQYEVWVETQG